MEQKIINKETNVRIAYLTFDDGPYELTDKYLEVLDEYNARGTFFVLGKPKLINTYKKIIKSGHTIANHTYSHREGLYTTTNNFVGEVIKLQNYLYNNTGVITNIVRFPGGSSNAGKLKKTIINELHKLGYGYVDWNCETGDGSNAKMKQMGAYERFKLTLKNKKIAVVLMHDYNYKTYKDLPKIITYLRNNNYLILPLFKESVVIN